MRTRPLVIHPVLFAAFPVVALYAGNVEETPAGEVAVPLLIVIAAAVAAFALLARLLGDVPRAGTVVSVLALVVLSYGYVYRATERLEVAGVAVGRHRFLLPLWLVLGTAGLVLAFRGSRWSGRVTPTLNSIAAVLVAFNVLTVVVFHLGGSSSASATPLPAAKRPLVPPRDVYYIVFDRYGGADALREEFGFDNTPFIDGLRARGFFVADDSRANYPKTLLSMASSLNMQYLNAFAEDGAVASASARDALRVHAVGRFFQAQGYRYIHMGSWWGPTADIPTADANVAFGGLSEFSTALFETTAIAPVATALFDDLDPRRREHSRVLFQFDQLGRMPEVRGPKLVVAHVLAPHEPFVFDRDGSFVTEEQEEARGPDISYVRQLEYVNARILELVDRLQAGPDARDPVIILQADEGPFEGPSSWPRIPGPSVRRKFPILNAYALPGVNTSGLSPGITPVNSFRTVLNLYFGTELPLLPDRSFVFQKEDRRYRFIDVTERVRA